MSYVTSPYAPRARRVAVNLVIKEGWSAAAAARHAGVHRSTVGRWLKKAARLNSRHTFLYNESARPKHPAGCLDPRVVAQIIVLRRTLRRCAPVIHFHLQELGIPVSLSSVQRTLRRRGLTKPRSKWARFRPSMPRPRVEHPGDLVQTDTVHYMWPDGRRAYLYTVVDVCSRWAYVEYHERVLPDIATAVILRAQDKAGFTFRMVQSDNGPEYSKWFTDRLLAGGIASRHSRVRRPNDNAHIERFNRTVQEECFGGLRPQVATAGRILSDWLRYYNESRLHLGIMTTPARIVAKVLT